MDELPVRMQAMQDEVEEIYRQAREDLERRRVELADEFLRQQKRYKESLLRFVLDRADLPYLNLIEKFNCFYCSYGNGVAAYFREVAARTEQYWCPIKHGRRYRAAHDRYPGFFDHGDAEAYRLGLERLRHELGATAEKLPDHSSKGGK